MAYRKGISKTAIAIVLGLGALSAAVATGVAEGVGKNAQRELGAVANRMAELAGSKQRVSTDLDPARTALRIAEQKLPDLYPPDRGVDGVASPGSGAAAAPSATPGLPNNWREIGLCPPDGSGPTDGVCVEVDWVPLDPQPEGAAAP